MPKPPSITRIGLRGREFLAVEVGGTEHLRGPFCVKDFSDSIFPDQNFVSLALAHAMDSAWRVRPERVRPEKKGGSGAVFLHQLDCSWSESLHTEQTIVVSPPWGVAPVGGPAAASD